MSTQDEEQQAEPVSMQMSHNLRTLLDGYQIQLDLLKQQIQGTTSTTSSSPGSETTQIIAKLTLDHLFEKNWRRKYSTQRSRWSQDDLHFDRVKQVQLSIQEEINSWVDEKQKCRWLGIMEKNWPDATSWEMYCRLSSDQTSSSMGARNWVSLYHAEATPRNLTV
jgi:hypothetical protein